jgi:hypothetical protein
MKQSEVIELIKLIDRVYKTDYAGDSDVVKDWFKVLKQYDFNDMTDSLEYYMQNYTEYPPKVYNLIKGYQTIESKKILDHAKTRCIFCNKEIDFTDEEHVNKCRSIEFIKSAVKRFKNQDIDKERYLKMSKEEFQKYYNASIDLVINNSTNEREVNMWKKVKEGL